MHDDVSQFGLEPQLVARYLNNLGWITENTKTGLRRVWLPENGAETPIEIFLSDDEKTKHRNLYFALTTISQFYEKALEVISNEIKSLAYDIISSKIPTEYVRNDSIELRIAAEYLEKMKFLLSSAATTEITNSRYYKRVLKDGIDYSERCRFGHTFRGSFGFHIESPVGLNDNPTLNHIEEIPPFERRIVERISTGLASLTLASEQNNSSLIVEEENGLSSNMCDALIDIIEDVGVSRIDMVITLSPEWRSHISAHGNEYSIRHHQVDILRDASKALRIDESPKETHIVGRIKRLETEGNPADLIDDKSSREIEVSWINDNNQLAHVKISLSPMDYLMAVEAHRDGLTVSSFGTLKKTGRIWRLEKIKYFKIVH